MRILITGGAGYLGSILVPHLLDLGHDVTVVDSLRFQQAPLLDSCIHPGFEFVAGDCRDERLMCPLVAKADAIIPLAAIVGAPACSIDQTAAVTTNRDAVALLARLRTNNQMMLMPVTNSGYGVGDEGVECTEESPLRPVSLYGRTKVEAERLMLDSGNAISFRLATVFGASPRMRLDLLVNDFVYRAVTDRSAVLFESHFKRNYIHVRDVARVFAHGIEHYDAMKGRPYNVGLSDANLSKRELCERIATHVPGFVFFDSPIGQDPDQRNYIVSNARIEATGWRPAFSLDDGIRELIKAYRIVRQRAHTNV
jgi:nucleoside-diphosphate-sugar epimerase